MTVDLIFKRDEIKIQFEIKSLLWYVCLMPCMGPQLAKDCILLEGPLFFSISVCEYQ